MRKALTALVTLALCLFLVLPAQADPAYRTAVFTIGSTTTAVNGQTLTMDLAPFVDPATGRTYVPVRYLAGALGAQVAWDAANQTITLTMPGSVVVLTIGSSVLVVNGQALSMDATPQIVPPGRTVLPARWVAEAFGFTVNWLPVLHQVYVTDQPPVTLTPSLPAGA
ncbi:MAG TPA: copper amine oxidase N-terminal domain-containing protein [Spirochaetia bacterium]|nr:copper amine oxidase N-terminal domain-containing protein [Spirochaetia bacterium]